MPQRDVQFVRTALCLGSRRSGQSCGPFLSITNPEAEYFIDVCSMRSNYEIYLPVLPVHLPKY
jgi:hypothetical protein